MARGDTNGCTRCGRTVNGLCAQHKKCVICHSVKEFAEHQTRAKRREVPNPKFFIDNLKPWQRRAI